MLPVTARAVVDRTQIVVCLQQTTHPGDEVRIRLDAIQVRVPLVTRQGGAIVPISFDEIMDPATGRTRVRLVDTSTESHASAWALQVRIEPADLEDVKRLEALAQAAGLTPEEARVRYAPALGA